MKKLVLIAMITISSVATFVSCSKSEDTPVVPNVDLAVGNWYKTAETIQTGLNGTPQSILIACESTSLLEFLNDTSGTIPTGFIYKTPHSGTNCTAGTRYYYGYWENRGNGNYKIGYSSGDVELGTVTFSNNNRTMLWTIYFNNNTQIAKVTYTKQ